MIYYNPITWVLLILMFPFCLFTTPSLVLKYFTSKRAVKVYNKPKNSLEAKCEEITEEYTADQENEVENVIKNYNRKIEGNLLADRVPETRKQFFQICAH